MISYFGGKWGTLRWLARFVHAQELHVVNKEPPILEYYLDPDVSEVVFRVTILNGDPDAVNHKFYANGSYCELAQHLHLPPVYARYGEDGKWNTFRPIQVSFSASSQRRPTVSFDPRANHVHVVVPAAAVIEVSIVPVVGTQKLMNTALQAASTAQLALRKNFDPTKNLLLVPTVVAQKLRVVHCVRAPAMKPLITSTLVQTAPNGESVALAERGDQQQTAELHGPIDLDAASTSQVRLQASWYDIDDNPVHTRFVLMTGTSATAPRSISFDRYNPPSGPATAQLVMTGAIENLRATSMWDKFDLQCAENKVFLGPATPELLSSAGGRACVLNFSDTRRKQATVSAIATGRYKDHFPQGAASSFEVTSDDLLVEVPASMRLPPPDISHVMPLSRDFAQHDAESSQTRRAYAMRIYGRRPWFVSGPCERLAVGCRAGEADGEPSASLDKYVTQALPVPPGRRIGKALAGRKPSTMRLIPRSADDCRCARPSPAENHYLSKVSMSAIAGASRFHSG